EDAKFALVAFVDELVLTNESPVREQWYKFPLQFEYFREQLAGEKFFERLDGMLGRAEMEADVIELYYLCLLLNYKGRYNIFFEDQLKGVITNVADHLRRVNRLRTSVLSPHWRADDQPESVSVPGLPTWVKIYGGAALALVVVIYLALHFFLSREVSSTLEG